MLAASGVHPKTAQDLMRHSDINLTMSRYTHTLRGQTALAIEALPDFGLPSSESQTAKATGTDGKWEDSAYKPAYKKLTKNAFPNSSEMSSIGKQDERNSQNSNSPKSCKSGMLDNKKGRMSSSGLQRAREDSNLQPSDSKSATLSN